MLIKQGETTAARRTIYFTAVNTADDSAYTGALSGADIMVGKAGGAEAASTGAATHIATGLFKYVLAAAECDTLGEVSLRIAKSGVYNDVRACNVVAFDPYTGSDLGLTNLDTSVSSRSSHDVGDIWDMANGVETGLTPIQALRAILAEAIGKISGVGTNTVTARAAITDSKVRVTATLDSSGNRTSVVTDLS